MSVTLNGAAFARRVKALYASWELDNTDAGLWLGSQVVVVANGKASEDTLYQKSVALQTWLLGYEFPETVVLLTKDHSIHILASSKKIAILETLEAAVSAEGMTLVTITRNKKDADATNIASLVDIIKGAGETNKIGMVASDYTGKLMQAWTASMTEAGIETVDITTPISDLLAIKDETELETVASAAALSVGALKAFLVPTIERIIDEEREISHRKLAESTDEKFERPDRLKVTGVEEDACDSCFTPIIQSGGKYSLKPSAQSNDDNLHFGTIVVSLGGRYKSYCSAVTRTYMVDPSKTQENAYKCAVDLLAHLVTLLNPGVRLSELVTKATEFVQERDESLVDHMVSNLGFGMGIEFRESRLLINARSTVRAKAGMVFNLQVGFKNLINPDAEEGDANHTFAVWIGDTVVVGAETSRVLTADATSNPKDVLYYFKEGADAGTSAAEAAAVALAGTGETGYKMRDRGDKAPGAGEAAAEEARRQHQIQIAKKRHDEARRRVLGELGDDPEEEQDNKIVNAYPNPASFPNNIKNGRIYVDRDREAVIVPLYGYMVPFHISTIKSATTSEEGNFMYLRINFNTPGMAFGAKGHNFEDPQATFVRELSFRSRDASNLNATMRSIKELRKRSTARQKEAAEMEDLVVQPKLQVMRNARPPRLTDVQMRPHLGGRKTVGMLEAHSNGLRFMSRKGEQLDIIYANIKHAFFQPAEGELIVLLHFHLRNPIMVGKKAVNDVQVFTEVMEASQNISKNRRGGFDRDEIENEQRERQLRNRLNAEFKGFMTKVESISTTSGTDLEFDVPYRELGFYGVPQRATVFVMPTVHCIVHLVEPPFFVCTLEEVELAYLERVEFSLRNFDMVLVQKDYTKPVMKINTIPMQYLEAIKEYLDSCDILYYEGRANLNWKQIMKPIIEDPKGFFDLGGWDFLDPEKEMLEAAGEGAEIVEEGSEYVPSEDPDEMSSDDYSLEAYSSSSISEGGDDELSEEGLDWDRLAKHATEEERRKEDKKKRKSRTRDTRSPKRRKR